MKSLWNRLLGLAWIAVLSMGVRIQADDASVKYDGLTFDRAFEGFQSDLNPAIQAKALKALIQFAIRNHHAEEVAQLLIQEGRVIPLEILLVLDPTTNEPMLIKLMDQFEDIPQVSPEGEDSLFSLDDMRHWRQIFQGIHRLAVPQRNVFEEAMNNTDNPFNVRALARIAVQHAELQEKASEKWLEYFSQKMQTAQPEIRVNDIIMVVMDKSTEVVVTTPNTDARTVMQAGHSEKEVKASKLPLNLNEEYRFGVTVADILPDDTLVLEGRKAICRNQDLIQFHLTGQVHRSAIGPDRKVSSLKITDLEVQREFKKKYYAPKPAHPLVSLGSWVLDQLYSE